MKTRLIALSCLLTLATVVAVAQNSDEVYPMATVVSIDKVPANAQHPENADRYKISMRLGDTIYSCHANAPTAVFLDWSPGKQYPAKLMDKVLQVKGPHGQVDLNIDHKKTAK
jgi:hypothetical protein